MKKKAVSRRVDGKLATTDSALGSNDGNADGDIRQLLTTTFSNAAATLAAGHQADMPDDHPLRGSHQADRNLSPDGGAGFLIMARAADVQQGVAANLAQLDSGGVVRCRRCGKTIPLRRLKAAPETGHCFECQSSMEPKRSGLHRRRW
ncbi:MAG: TraR/DksA C4-type zinc finger protein [Candidatus Kerfeldbacteria bacterium]|nr:TraR/DksA C4-type zinc finger protein [Candidatus Kerfeldbacteria bacterium]